jgi:hypothetical protein
MKKYRNILLSFVVILLAPQLFAQGPPPPPPPPGLPVDGGLIILFLTAIGYGYKKIKE